jgi:thioredoxin-like negative regulator of GroEL
MASALKGFWQSRSDNVLKPPKFEAYKAYLEARSVWIEDPSQAEQLLRKSIELDPEFIDAYFLLLDWFYNHRQFSEAAGMLDDIKTRFTNLTPRQKNYLQYHLADNQGHNVDAFNHFILEYERDPKDLFVNTSGMVLAMEYVNDPRKAVEFFVQINPDSLDLAQDIYSQNRIAIAISAYYALGKLRESESLAQKLRQHVQGRRDYQKLIEFYVATKDTVSANQLLSQAQMHVEQPYKPYLYLVAGRQAQLRGDMSLRDFYARRSAALSPDSSRALARSYYLMDSLGKALAIYQLALQKDTTDNRIYAEMGVIYARLGQKDLAEQMVNTLDQLKPEFDYGNTPYYKGRIAANLGERERALRLLSESLNAGNKFFDSVTFIQDTDLMMLRRDPEYKKLLKRL